VVILAAAKRRRDHGEQQLPLNFIYEKPDDRMQCRFQAGLGRGSKQLLQNWAGFLHPYTARPATQADGEERC